MGNEINTSGGASVGGDVDTGGGDFVSRDKIFINLSLLDNIQYEAFISVFESLQERKRVDKQILLEQHIEPLFHKLERVHKDYEITLFELGTKIANKEVELSTIYEWFARESLRNRSERIYLVNIFDEFALLLDKDESTPDLNKAIREFLFNVVLYFDLSQVTHASPFTIFREMLLQIINSPKIYSSKNETEQERIEKLKSRLNYTVFEHLPQAWANVCRAYLTLKGKYLFKTDISKP